MTPKRWTLAVVCAATAMLMLDIAVVNTALSRDRRRPRHRPQRPAVGRRRLHARARRDRADRGLARRPLRPPPPLHGRPRRSSRVASPLCAAAGDIASLDAARAVQGIGAAMMFAVSLAILADAFPDAKERAGALAAYGATIGALVRRRPARRRRAHQRPRLAVDLPHQPPARRSPAWRSPARRRASRATRARRASTRPARLTLDRRPVPARVRRCCAATRTAGAARRSSPRFGGAAALLVAFVAVERRVARADAPARAVPQPGRSPARRSPRSRSRRRSSRSSST